MNKQKSTTLLVAGLVSTGLVGATLAYFSSSDSLTNFFVNKLDGQGIIAVEDYGTGEIIGQIEVGDLYDDPGIKMDSNGNEFTDGYTADDKQYLVNTKTGLLASVLPGDEVSKKMAAFNSEDFDVFVRADFEVQFLYNGSAVTHYVFDGDKYTFGTEEDLGSNPDVKVLTEQITLSSTTSDWGVEKGQDTTIVPGQEYFLINKLGSIEQSPDLLENYTLEPIKDGDSNVLRELTYSIKMNVDAVQAANYPADGYESEGWPALNNGVLDVTALNPKP